MNLLRWLLMMAAALIAAAWASLLIFGNGFRQSFGASATGPVMAILPFALTVLLLLSLQRNASRVLLHCTAAAVLVAVPLILSSADGKIDPSLAALFVFFGLWFVYYVSTAFSV